jgi:hypothetical protein
MVTLTMITTVFLDNSDTLATLILYPFLHELMTLVFCSQKIVFFVMLTTTLKVTTMKIWMKNLLMMTLKAKTLMMKTWMENLLI